MAQLLPVSTWGLKVAPNVGPEEAFGLADEPGTLQLTMAAIDPGEDVSSNHGVSEFKKPRATVKMIIVKEPFDDEDDDEDDDDIDMDGLLGEDDSESEDENGEGPSDPSRSPKEMKKAALKKALKEDREDVLANAAKGKGKAATNGDIDMNSDDEDLDEQDLPPEAQTIVLCTLDPDSHFNQPLNITIPLRETVAFRVEGTHSIHLSGNIVYNPADEPPYGSETSDSEEEDEDVDLSPDEDELDVTYESESDELDDMDDPRVTELASEDEEAPKLVKTGANIKTGNKRPAEDSLLDEKDDKPTADSILSKALKKDDGSSKSPEINGDKLLSKTQLKKMRKKMKDNAGNAVEMKQEIAAGDEGEKITTELKKESPGTKAKQVQFAEKLVQGPGVNGAGSLGDKNAKVDGTKKGSKGGDTKGSNAGGKVGGFATRVVDGVKIEDRKAGDGPQAKKGDSVSCRYIGKLENKKEFDANRKGTPFKFKLGTGAVIKGMDTGLQGMAVGGERRITIPPHLGYGKKANEAIPANSTLIFDVRLLEIH